MNRISWILFDLGGVVIEVEQSRIFDDLGRLTGREPQAVRSDLLLEQPFWEQFVVQEFSPQQLTKKINQVLGSTLREDSVVAAFNAELGRLIESTAQLIPALRQSVRVGCLSNTNSIHWDHMLRSYEVMSHFDRRFASQMLGYAKPSPAIYQRVLEHLKVPPEEILFFDDRAENVSAAEQLGWNARLYSNHEGLLADLEGVVG